jgi:ankyrin repeat protein
VSSAGPLYYAAGRGKLDVVRLLLREMGADINQAAERFLLLYAAAHEGHEHIVRCLVKEFGADSIEGTLNGDTNLYAAALAGKLHVVRFLVKEFGADVNLASRDGSTPLMAATERKHAEVVVWLTKHSADSQAPHTRCDTAADVSKVCGAPAEQTAYLEARTHCAKPGCSGAGLKKCAICLVIFYCCKDCQVTHWSTHRAECERSTGKAADKGKRARRR